MAKAMMKTVRYQFWGRVDCQVKNVLAVFRTDVVVTKSRSLSDQSLFGIEGRTPTGAAIGRTWRLEGLVDLVAEHEVLMPCL
jgi:hypothetical protein